MPRLAVILLAIGLSAAREKSHRRWNRDSFALPTEMICSSPSFFRKCDNDVTHRALIFYDKNAVHPLGRCRAEPVWTGGLVSRFQSSHDFAAGTLANFGIEATLENPESRVAYGFEGPKRARHRNEWNFNRHTRPCGFPRKPRGFGSLFPCPVSSHSSRRCPGPRSWNTG
jgi:hypothetical protein